MNSFPEGNAIIYCEGCFQTPRGKTAHGLVRGTKRYHVLSVVDSHCASKDAGVILDGHANGVLIYRDVEEAVGAARKNGDPASHLVIGLAPDGGRFNDDARSDIMKTIRMGLHIDSGLHDFLSEDFEIAQLASNCRIRIRDIRKSPPRQDLHFFSGKIQEVTALKVAVLGTDSAVGKRTTAWGIVDALQAAGCAVEFIGTGQTSWMQGCRYGIMLDALINDFVSGEIEHIVWTAWKESQPQVIVIEGQGSLMNPAYPGGYEILAAGRPDVVILQHAPARQEYDGFPGYPIHSLGKQIEAIELLSGKPVVAVTLNHEKLDVRQVSMACEQIRKDTGLPACDILLHGASQIVHALMPYLERSKEGAIG
ncbi:MAG: DUF1611 domain-containing protein [Desulfobacterales bacterium]|nr:MAG: DUF1611 domain-containing protein [Desulfobacterales bacterium]